ncbi:hypothetical protein [Streptomyces griseus]|uniref:hypothetical protein n=1 Tax=Streptomyces griseus TaxID=1911 RepID=UPI0004CB4E24|nr:hypothetical protein [Streptomyces griseus]
MQIRRWLPDQPTLIGRHDWPEEGDEGTHLRLRAGAIVVLDRRAWRVLEITGYPGDHWPEAYEKAWRDHMELWWHANELRRVHNQSVKPASDRGDFYKRPVVLVLRDENLPRSAPKHWCAPASQDWQVLPEHYAICRACGELPPCHHGEYSPEGGPRIPEQSGGIPLLVPEGCCMGCAEEIKPRMRTVRFPGPNLWYPDLGEDTAVFHSRAACEDQVALYRSQWQAAHPQPAVHPPTPVFPGFDHFFLPRARHDQDVSSAPLTHAQGSLAPHVQGSMAPLAQGPAAPHGQGPVTPHGQGSVTPHTQGSTAPHAQGSVTSHGHSVALPHGHGPALPHGQSALAPHGQAPAAHGQAPAAPRPQEEPHASLVTGSGAFSPAFDDYRPEPDPYASPSAPSPRPALRTAPTAQTVPAAQTAAPAHAGVPGPSPAPLTTQSQAEAQAQAQSQAPVPSSAPVPAPTPADVAAPAVRAAEELSRSLSSPPVFHNAEQAARVIEELTAAVRNIALCLNSPQARSHPHP